MNALTDGKFWLGVGATVVALIIFQKFISGRIGGNN